MLRNQLALTEGLRDNQKAITQGFSQFERLADMKELPGLEAIKDEEDEAQAPIEKEEQVPKEKKAQDPIAKFKVEEFDRYLINKESQDLLKSNGHDHLPSYYFDRDVDEISTLINAVNTDLEDAQKNINNTAIIKNKDGYSIANPKSQNPKSKTIDNIKIFNALSIYSSNLNHVLMYKEKSGTGIFFFNPEELLKRFQLLVGSLSAGNNGVIPELIQLAHHLKDLGIITINQLNKILRSIYT